MSKKFVSNKDETVRMFENNFLESLSKVHWSVPLWIYVPIISYLIFLSIFEFYISLFEFFIQTLSGVGIWTLTEYILHRFIFHYHPKSKLGKRIHFMFHGVHHDYPNDSKRLVMPPSVSLPLATAFYFIFKVFITSNLLAPFFAGFLIGYLFYDITHYAIHHFNMKSEYWLKIKNHHMLHHYKEDDKGFGVSFPFWDYIFGTRFTKKSTQ